MKLEFREHELERALEVYLQGLMKQPVKVNGFDLSGMRSKEGLSAMVDISIEGETDAREPKTESSNVKPTNTSWREQKASEPTETETVKPLEVQSEKSEDYYKVLEFLSENPKNKNRKQIEDLTRDNTDLVLQLVNVALYQDFLAQCAKEDAEKEVNPSDDISEEERKERVARMSPSNPYGIHKDDETLDREEQALDELVLGGDNLQENDNGAVAPYQPEEPDLDEKAEEALVNSMVTTNGEEPKRTIVDDVLEDKPEEPKKSLFGEPLNKPTRKLFG